MELASARLSNYIITLAFRVAAIAIILFLGKGKRTALFVLFLSDPVDSMS